MNVQLTTSRRRLGPAKMPAVYFRSVTGYRSGMPAKGIYKGMRTNLA